MKKSPLALRNEIKKQQDLKKFESLYLTPHFIFSYHGITDFVIVSTRGTGKSVISVEAGIILKRKYGYENVKIFYFRIKDESIKALLANKAQKAIDPYLINKYNLQITVKNNTIYDHGKPLIEFYSLVSAGSKGKGVNLYDCNFLEKRPIGKDGKPIKRFIVTIWDEFMLEEGTEKRSVGDPLAQYIIYREAIFRDAGMLDYDAVYNFLLANNVSECANVTGVLYNYIPYPGNTRRVKLTRKRALVWNMPVTDAYIEKRKKSINANIINYAGDDPNYTALQRDLTLIKPKSVRIMRLSYIIKFSKREKDWFCVYDNKYVRLYRNESFSKDKVIAMRRYLDNLFNEKLAKTIIERYDARSFMYTDIQSQASFQTQLKLIKNK